MTVSTIRQQLFIFSVVASLPGVALAAGPLNLDASGVAIHGHDPVAYFVDGKTVPSRADYSATAQGAGGQKTPATSPRQQKTGRPLKSQ